MIIAESLSLIYPDGTTGLEDVHLHLDPGSLVYVIGPSGSGKTSLLKLLLGIEKPTSGSLTVMGTSMNQITPSDLRKLRQSTGPVFQGFRLIPGKTALENVLLGLRFLPLSRIQMMADAEKALRAVGLYEKKDAQVTTLSFGQAQRVAIARATARKPQLILADEPTGNLDHDNARIILDLLEDLVDDQTTVIITTHATHMIEEKKNPLLIRVEEGRVSLG